MKIEIMDLVKIEPKNNEKNVKFFNPEDGICSWSLFKLFHFVIFSIFHDDLRLKPHNLH